MPLAQCCLWNPVLQAKDMDARKSSQSKVDLLTWNLGLLSSCCTLTCCLVGWDPFLANLVLCLQYWISQINPKLSLCSHLQTTAKSCKFFRGQKTIWWRSKHWIIPEDAIQPWNKQTIWQTFSRKRKWSILIGFYAKSSIRSNLRRFMVMDRFSITMRCIFWIYLIFWWC